MALFFNKKFIKVLVYVFSFTLSLNIMSSADKTDIIADGAKWFNTASIPKEQLKNKIILVELFKTWIESTENTASYMNMIYDAFKNEDVLVLGISTEQPEAVEKYIKKNNIKYPVAIGSSSMLSYKVDIPALFLIINGEIHSYDTTKKFKFNYLWSALDNKKIAEVNPDEKWFEERRNKYFTLYKKSFKESVQVMETTTINDIPMDFDIKYFEQNIYEKIVEEENKTFILSVYNKETSFKKYLLKEGLSDADKKRILNILQILKYKTIKINETFFQMTVDGMKRIVDKDFKNPLGAPSVSNKKFYNMLKKGQENIYDIIEINIDGL